MTPPSPPTDPIEMWLLVVAHPDDESMFFIPALRNLIRVTSPTTPCDKNMIHHPDKSQSRSYRPTVTNNRNVEVLCLSNGDYRAASDGPVREKEMHAACTIIGGCKSMLSIGHNDQCEDGRIAVTVLNDARMKDGPEIAWSSEYVSEVVLEHVRQLMVRSSCTNQQEESSAWDYISIARRELNHQQQVPPPNPSSSSSHKAQSINLNLMTFDEGGVSGHTNHVDVYRGIRYLLHEKCHVISKSGVDGKDNCNTTLLRLCRKKKTPASADLQYGGGEGGEIIEINVSVHTLNTISNPLYKYFLWAFVDLFPFFVRLLVQMILYILFFFLGALPWMDQKSTSTAWRKYSGMETIHRTSAASTMQFRIMDPILVWRAMAAHHSQFVWYRRLSVIFSRYTYINDLQTMTIDNRMLSSMGEDSDGDENMIASLLTPVVAIQEHISSPKFLLSSSQMNVLREAVLPPGLYHRPWKRIYSLLRDGDSFVAFQTLVTEWCKCQGQQSSLLVVKTADGDIIGGYADVPLINLSLSLSVVGGAGRSCLFKFSNNSNEEDDQDLPSMVKVYGKQCTTTSKKIVFDAYRRIIAFGGGESSDCTCDDEGFGLSLEDGFVRGTTARCAAFDNEPLVSDRGGVFDVVDVEVWGFAFGQL